MNKKKGLFGAKVPKTARSSEGFLFKSKEVVSH